MHTKTKIVCTIGPSVNSMEKIIALMHAGMNVARLNFSHGTHETHAEAIRLLKAAREQLNQPLAILLDTKGPEIRLGKIAGDSMLLETGQQILLVRERVEGNSERVSINPPQVLDHVHEGTRILFDDGYIGTRVVSVTSEGVLVQVTNGGILRSGKGVNIPHGRTGLPIMTEVDKEDIRFGCEQDIDLIAASFVRLAEDIADIKRYLVELKKPGILVLAKIENAEGVQNIDAILQVADGIMVARGDLGVEVPISQVPRLQKMMIRKCYLAGKPSVTATQMLESMIQNPRPTRAEVSDVANAIYDSTSAVMLSGETAVGRYPIETVQVMQSIIHEAESDFSYRLFFDQHSKLVYNDVPSALTLATVKTAYSCGAKALFVFTTSGATARLISRLRPKMPIIGMTDNLKSYHQLAINWGVTPYFCTGCRTLDDAFQQISRYALENHYVSYGDLVVVTAGSPFGVAGTTNTMIVESIGDVLVRGTQGIGERLYGKVTLVLSPDNRQAYTVRDQILVLTRCEESYRALIAEAAAVLLQNSVDDLESEKVLLELAKTLGKTAIIRADAAVATLKEGQLVTLDPAKALVYKGVVLEH